jgi:hypothetical protein
VAATFKKFRKNAKVSWKWLGREIHGKVLEIFTEPTTIEIKGKKIKRNGSSEKPAYVVESEIGNRALKLHTELKARANQTQARQGPTMFSTPQNKSKI